MTKINVAELIARCVAATPGVRILRNLPDARGRPGLERRRHDDAVVAVCGAVAVVIPYAPERGGIRCAADAELLAACDPATIRTLAEVAQAAAVAIGATRWNRDPDHWCEVDGRDCATRCVQNRQVLERAIDAGLVARDRETGRIVPT